MGWNPGKTYVLPLAVVDAVKKAVSDHTTKPFIIGYRLSPEERENPGITMEETLQLVDKFANQDLDYLHISVGDRVPVMGVGMLRTPDEVMKAFETGVPLIALGRELIMEPLNIKKERPSYCRKAPDC